MKGLKLALSFCLLFLMTACDFQVSDDGDDSGTISGRSGTLTALSGVATVEECPNDGVTLDHGIDKNGDGELSPDEVLNTYVICHGRNVDNAELLALQTEIDELKAAVEANTAKAGITLEEQAAIAVNTAKVGVTPEMEAAVEANTVKVGISQEEQAAIAANTAKVGYSEVLVAANTAVALNTAKVGITEAEQAAVEANSNTLTAIGDNPAFANWDKDTSDDLTTSHAASSLTSDHITNWDMAYDWGNHAGLYMASDHVASGVSASGIANWDEAHGWGNHAGLYMASDHAASGVTSVEIANWDLAYDWGDHLTAVNANAEAIATLEEIPYACAAGFTGLGCVYSDAVTCNSNGSAQWDGGCVCDANYVGASCLYSDAVTCNDNGTAQADGSCICSATYAGSACTYSDAVTCNDNGTAQGDGSCVCATGWSGATCDQFEGITLAFQSTVTSTSEWDNLLPDGVEEDATVTFSLDLVTSAMTLTDAEDCNESRGHDTTTGCYQYTWELPANSTYTLTYSSGYTQTATVTIIQILNGGVTESCRDDPCDMSNEDDKIFFYDGDNKIYEVRNNATLNPDSWLVGEIDEDFATAIEDIDNSDDPHFALTFYWGDWGDWGTYHYDYSTPQNRTVVTKTP